MVSDNAFDFKRILNSPTEFAQLLTIMDKEARMRRLNHSRVQRHFFQNYSIGKRTTDIIVKPRQAKMTTAIVGEISRLTWSRPTRALSLIDSDKNTPNVREMADRFYTHFPEVLDIGGTLVRKTIRYRANDTLTRYENGSRWVIGTAGAKTTGVGSTIDVLHLSEMSKYTDDRAILVGAMQAAERAFWKVWESTANGAIDGQLFYERSMQALDGDKDYKLHFYPWWWVEEYELGLDPDEAIDYTAEEAELIRLHSLTPEQVKWRRAKIREMGPEFHQEYPESVESAFLHSGFGYFGDVSGFFSAPMPVVYDGTHEYVAGLDFSQLTENDYLALMIGDITTGKHVDTLRINSGTFKAARADIIRYIKKWNIRYIRAEKNGARGEIERLRDDCADEGLDVTIWSFDMSATSKPKLMHEYRAALQEGALGLQDLPVVRAELRSAKGKETARGWTVESARDKNGHGDTVVAGALMWKAMCGL